MPKKSGGSQATLLCQAHPRAQPSQSRLPRPSTKEAIPVTRAPQALTFQGVPQALPLEGVSQTLSFALQRQAGKVATCQGLLQAVSSPSQSLLSIWWQEVRCAWLGLCKSTVAC